MKMKKFIAKVVGVISGVDDGKRVRVPLGPCDIEDSGEADDIKINWVQGEAVVSVSIPIEEYEQYIRSGDIRIIS
jgi:hypothetical protein